MFTSHGLCGFAARDTDIAVARFNATGQPDQIFGTNGNTRLDLSTGTVSGTAFREDTVWGLTLLPADQLLVIGGKLANGAGRTDTDYTVMKLMASGAVDSTFDTNMLVTLAVGTGVGTPRTAIVQPDGKLILSGHRSDAVAITPSCFDCSSMDSSIPLLVGTVASMLPCSHLSQKATMWPYRGKIWCSPAMDEIRQPAQLILSAPDSCLTVHGISLIGVEV